MSLGYGQKPGYSALSEIVSVSVGSEPVDRQACGQLPPTYVFMTNHVPRGSGSQTQAVELAVGIASRFLPLSGKTVFPCCPGRGVRGSEEFDA